MLQLGALIEEVLLLRGQRHAILLLQKQVLLIAELLLLKLQLHLHLRVDVLFKLFDLVQDFLESMLLKLQMS